jgi:hypothetical protein
MLAGWPNNIIHDQACITWSARGCRRFGPEIVRLLPMHFQANRTLPFAKPTKTSTARGGENLLEGTSWIVVEFITQSLSGPMRRDWQPVAEIREHEIETCSFNVEEMHLGYKQDAKTQLK